MTSHVIEWFTGIDWGSERHQVCVLNSTGEIVGERAFLYTGAGLAELGTWLATIAGEPCAMAVAIEVPHGPVVDVLLDCGFAVYAINPKQRDRFSVAGSKDDRRDARVAASGLHTDRHLFRAVQASDPAVVELREWSRLAEELQQERVRLCNRLRQQLWRYYPQLLELADDIAAEWLLELWIMAPTPDRAMRLRPTTVARLLKRHRIHRFDAAAVLAILRKPTIQVAAGVTEAAVLHIRSLIARLRLANQELRTAETPGLRCPENPLRGCACDKTQRKVSCRLDALCRPSPATQRRVLLVASGSSERSRDSPPLRGAAQAWPLIWSRSPWCGRSIA